MKKILLLTLIILVTGCTKDYTDSYTWRVSRIKHITEAYPNGEVYHIEKQYYIIVKDSNLFMIKVNSGSGITRIANLREILIKSVSVQEFSEEIGMLDGKYYEINKSEGILVNNEKLYKYKINTIFLDVFYELERIQ